MLILIDIRNIKLLDKTFVSFHDRSDEQVFWEIFAQQKPFVNLKQEKTCHSIEDLEPALFIKYFLCRT